LNQIDARRPSFSSLVLESQPVGQTTNMLDRLTVIPLSDEAINI
jgi:hypothetical protein